MIGVHITDAFRKFKARVTSDGALLTTTVPIRAPNAGATNVLQYLQGRLGATDLETGLVNQNVDGSVTPSTFIVKANDDYDIHIQQITIIIADSAVVHSKFGNVNPLPNGWDIKLTEAGVETLVINKAKTGGEAIAQSGVGRPFGDGATSFELSNWTATNDAQIINVPIGEFVPDGLRLGRGTSDKLESIVNDDLTGLTEFFVYIYGFKRFP